MSKPRSNPLLLALVVAVAFGIAYVALRPSRSSSADAVAPLLVDAPPSADRAPTVDPVPRSKPTTVELTEPANAEARREAERPRIRGRLVDRATDRPLAKWTVHLIRFEGPESLVFSDPEDDPIGSAFVRRDTSGPAGRLVAPRNVAPRIAASSGALNPDAQDGADEGELPDPKPPLLGTTVTNEAGLFEFECTAQPWMWLALDDQPPMFALRGRRALESSQACSSFVEWRVGIVERTLVHVRVVDDATDEPVPYLDVSLVGESTSESIVTDAAGTATTRRPFDVGEVRAAFHDGPDECRVHAVDAQAQIGTTSNAVTFRVTVGPTYRFAWRAGQGPDDARVRVRGLEPTASEAAVCPGTGWHALRLEDNGFLRYAHPVRVESGSRAFAEFQAADGLQSARVELTHVSGRGEPIPVAFALATALHGRVVGEDGDVIAGARVFALDARGATLDETFSDEQGRYFLGGLESTAVASLLVIHPTHARATIALSCVPGVDVVRDVTLGSR